MKDLLGILIIAVFLLSVPLVTQAIGWLSKRRTARQAVVPNHPSKANKTESPYANE